MKELKHYEISLWLINWNNRVEQNIVSIDDKPDIIDNLIDYLSYRNRDYHLDDIKMLVKDFRKKHTNFVSWYKCILEDSGFKLQLFDRKPTVELEGFSQWRYVTKFVDPDNLVALQAVYSTPNFEHELAINDTLSKWKVLVQANDPDLNRIIENGIAETHIHMEAADPISVMWLRYVSGWIELEAIKRYSATEIKKLKTNPSKEKDRLKEIELLNRAKEQRLKLCKELDLFMSSQRDLNKDNEVSIDKYLSDERVFLYKCWKRITRSGNSIENREFIDNFDTYLSAKNKFLFYHQHFSGMGVGLDTFRNYLDGSETITEGKAKKKSNLVLKNRLERLKFFAEESNGLKHIEYRISPKNSALDYKKFFNIWDKIKEEKREKHDINSGFIVHFIRSADKGCSDELANQALISRLDKQSSMLHNFRQKNHDHGKYIVGIDVANLERGCPPYLFAPFIKLLRGDVSILKYKCTWGETISLKHWGYLSSEGLHSHPMHLKKLGLTYHIGEDFFHLCDGIKYIDMLCDNVLEPGDRLGHALALGLNMSTVGSHSSRHITKGELLDNIVWLISYSSKLQIDRIELEKKMSALSADIYKEVYSWSTLYELMKSRYDLPPKKEGSHSNVGKIYHREVYDQDTKRKKTEPADFKDLQMLDELSEKLSEIQSIIIKKLHNKGCTIEINPSSNLATTKISDMKNHPMFKILDTVDSGLMISINTDDPGLFVTRLDNEYALVFKAMLDYYEGDRSRCVRYLEEMRKASIKSCFNV